MAVSEVLKNLRNSSYGSGKGAPMENPSARSIQLTSEEVVSIPPPEDGSEVTLEMTGKLEGSKFVVMTVSGQGGIEGENADAQSVMSGLRGPVTQMQTIPSPG